MSTRNHKIKSYVNLLQFRQNTWNLLMLYVCSLYYHCICSSCLRMFVFAVFYRNYVHLLSAWTGSRLNEFTYLWQHIHCCCVNGYGLHTMTVFCLSYSIISEHWRKTVYDTGKRDSTLIVWLRRSPGPPVSSATSARPCRFRLLVCN